MGKGLFHI